jgi:hypothetical integral membrane protein (TIGR02206 family)
MRQFSTPHIAALVVMVVAAAAAIWTARHGSQRSRTVISAALAAVIFAGWAGEYVADLVNHTWSVKYTLPLQLTDAVSVVTIAALLIRRRLLVELAYFWAFTASLQAVLTPDLAQSFPSVYYFTYFAYHVGAIVAAGFLVFGCRLYPRRGAVWRVYGLTLAWTAIAALGDVLTGGNYMYLRAKPVHSSLLSVLGPWPWYIVATAGLGLVMLLVLNAITNAVRAAVDPRVVVDGGNRSLREVTLE